MKHKKCRKCESEMEKEISTSMAHIYCLFLFRSDDNKKISIQFRWHILLLSQCDGQTRKNSLLPPKQSQNDKAIYEIAFDWWSWQGIVLCRRCCCCVVALYFLYCSAYFTPLFSSLRSFMIHSLPSTTATRSNCYCGNELK